MHPAMIHWWNTMRRASEEGCGAHAGGGCGPSHEGRGGGCGSSHEGRGGGHRHERWEASGDGGDYGSGAFGVRRPLRFLAWKLGLDEPQVGELAQILTELKTERAQADVNARRTLAAFADAVAGDAFDEGKAGEAGALRVKTAEQLREAVLKALRRIHALLGPEQRKHLAYLIRTGALTI